MSLLTALVGACAAEAADPVAETCGVTQEKPHSVTAPVTFGLTRQCYVAPDDYPKSLSVDIEAPTSAVVLLDREELTFDVLGPDEVRVEAAGPNRFCEDELPVHYHVEFDSAGTYALQFGPSGAATPFCFLLIEGAAHTD